MAWSGLKTHSKITLVVRREETGIRRYVHLATGNYNDSTAKLYTDCGIFTCDERFGEDATAVFNMLSGYSEPKRWNKLIVAPIWMKDRFLSLIEREAENAKKGLPAQIRAKMNSLCDPKIMAGLVLCFFLWRTGGTSGKRNLLPESGDSGSEREHSGSFHCRRISWNTAVFSILKTAEIRKSIWEAQTGCRVIWTAVWRLFSL